MSKTIIQFFEESVQNYGNNPFLWEKTTTKFEPTTYKETQIQAHQIAAGLMSLGIQAGERIALLSEGRNAWIVGELGILHAGAVNVPLSIKLDDSSDLIFRLQHSDSKIVFVSGNMLPKIRKIIDELPLIEKVIVFDQPEELLSNEMTLEALKIEGLKFIQVNNAAFIERKESIQGDDYANISYTSGTTSDPKGILLTHRNYTANVEQAYSLMEIKPEYKTLLILPLDHCFAHVAGFYSFMGKGASVATVQVGKTGMQTLKNIPVNIKEVEPDILLSVPALAKNFKKNIEAGIHKKGGITEKLFNNAIKLAISYNKDGYNKGGAAHFWKKPIMNFYDKIILSKIREAVFGKNMKFFIGGGALLGIDLQQFYYALGIPMMQGYGLSEATPIISSNSIDKHILGSSGHIVQPMEIKICDEEGKELPYGQKGEIVIRGENVMAGYWKNEASTKETVIDGWLHTGDMGYMRDSEFLYVVGRFKSLLIAPDGEKYSPEGIEEALVAQSKYIDQAMLYNSQDPYTIAMVVPNLSALKQAIESKGLSMTNPEGKEAALQLIQDAFNAYRKGGKYEGTFPQRWMPAAIGVLPEPFTEQNHMMNSTMKMVRGKIEKAYAEEMNYLFTPEAKNIINDFNLKSIK